ncbi:MAG: ClpXP protease specificity-enhancing factor SspB [Nannocystaceae bacterium]
MAHPVQSVVESLYASGRCPRLHVNASLEGVVCPDFIREQWQERLIIDLDASYPLDLSFDEHGLGADLSFGGYVTRCIFPWTAIYVVADRATGRGIVLEQNMPESVRQSRQTASEQPGTTKLNLAGRPLDLAPDDDADDDAPEARNDEITAPIVAGVAEPNGETHVSEDPAPSAEKSRQKSISDADVAERRAAFRVIDGGT